MRGRDGEPGESLAAGAGRYLGLGLTWALSTALFLLGGWAVDRWLGTMPLFLLVGAFIGAGAGFYSLYYHLVIEPRERKRRDAERER
ncbi:MAG: AtpZ/AtpI family protein [Longimicrobiales bacterium]